MLDYGSSIAFIIPCCLVGLLWAAFNLWKVLRIQLQTNSQEMKGLTDHESGVNKNQTMIDIGTKIQMGADEFLRQEYTFCAVWLLIMAVIIFFAVDEYNKVYTTFAFLIGGFTSIVSGYISMKIAVHANYRVAYTARNSLADAFRVAFSAGTSMGFSLVAIALLVLTIILIIYKEIGCDGDTNQDSQIKNLMEYISGYGLGGSTVALFGRVGGGIYTKAADVGADLVGKVEKDLPEDSPKNPATIADNVGDNVGDVAGMGSDLFGSFAESTCAALVVSGSQLVKDGDALTDINYLMFPLLVTAVGILVCLVTSAFPIFFQSVNRNDQIESTLKQQLLISTVGLTAAIIGIAYGSLPENYSLGKDFEDREPWHAFVSVLIGLWSGLAIGYITEYMTSHSYRPVREVSEACRTGAATNIIYGLALGYNSCVVPIIAITISAYVSHKLLGFYGNALAALGMLSNLPIGLAIDGYGPISDNAGGIAEMAELGEDVRERTDALDAAGNTTAAIGKGFAIGSAALVSLALYGGFITRAGEWTAEANADDRRRGLTGTAIVDPLIFAGLLLGAMLPYLFSAFTMKSVGLAAQMMVKEIQTQLKNNPGILQGTQEPDYRGCVKISTQASLKEMVAPGALVILSPFVLGILFGPKIIAGLLPGSLVSGVQMAISSANTGGAWDNAKKYIEAKNMTDENGNALGKGTDLHKAAVIGDTVGDPLKDTSGPSLNILIKLMAILSLVFTEFFCKTAWLVVPFNDDATAAV